MICVSYDIWYSSDVLFYGCSLSLWLQHIEVLFCVLRMRWHVDDIDIWYFFPTALASFYDPFLVCVRWWMDEVCYVQNSNKHIFFRSFIHFISVDHASMSLVSFLLLLTNSKRFFDNFLIDAYKRVNRFFGYALNTATQWRHYAKRSGNKFLKRFFI